MTGNFGTHFTLSAPGYAEVHLHVCIWFIWDDDVPIPSELRCQKPHGFRQSIKCHPYIGDVVVRRWCRGQNTPDLHSVYVPEHDGWL